MFKKLIKKYKERKRLKFLKLIGVEFKYNIDSIWNWWYYNKTIRTAMKLHKYYNKQFFIVPASATTVMIISSDWRKYRNRGLPKALRMTAKKLDDMCYFKTPRPNYCIKSKSKK